MNCTQTFLLFICLSLAFSQSSFADFIKASKAKCKENQLVEGGQCYLAPSSLSYKPCHGNSSCGEASNFYSKEELQAFFAKKPKNLRDQAFLCYSYDCTNTNNQQQNVDEADLLKTDGAYIYTISDKNLSIILAFPFSDAKLVSTINLDFEPKALFVEGRYLAVFGNDIRGAPLKTIIKIYNIEDKAFPELFRSFYVSGEYFSGRKLDNGFMYLISTHYLTAPWYDFGGGKVDISPESIFKYPEIYQTINSINIIAINLKNPNSQQSKIITVTLPSNLQTLYMSERNIYLVYPKFENNKDYIKIKKIFVSGTTIVPFADGVVRGSLISKFTVSNQFWLDEFNGLLRVSTTNQIGYNTWQSSNVYILDYNLNIFGALTGIAPTKRLYAVRFYERRCYLIAFEKVDPFYVVDLSNHRQPLLLGQLQIEGVSKYLHIYDQKTIIGFGNQVSPNNSDFTGIQISVFNVTNPSSPILSAFYNDSDAPKSDADTQHKAILFSKEKNLLVIPAKSTTPLHFNGAIGFRITKNEIAYQEMIDHSEINDGKFHLRNVQRSVIINEYLYTKSKCLLKFKKINQPNSQVRTIKIPCDDKPAPRPRPDQLISTIESLQVSTSTLK